MFDSEEVQSIIDQLNGLTAVKPHKIPPAPQDFTKVLRDHKERYTTEQAELAMGNILPKDLVRFLVERHWGYLRMLGKQWLAEGDQ